jgi:nucleotide-binding universal stress UspA family protein
VEGSAVVSGVSRVIVGASGSPASLRALRYAASLARHYHALLVPVLAWTPPGGELADRQAPCAQLRGLWQEDADRRLARVLGIAWGGMPPGLTVHPQAERGAPGPVLVDVANGEEDLLVIGTGPRGPLAWLRGGQVSRYCLRHSRCPVLAVPPPSLGRASVGHGLRGWAFWHRALTVDRARRDWGRAPA